MFGRRKRQPEFDGSAAPAGSASAGSAPDGSAPDGSAPDGSAPDGSAPAPAREKRDRLGSAMYRVLGPAAVQGALQGHSPEVRRAWKELQERNRQARREAAAGREADEPGSSPSL
ncbi:hypothetical protein GCM10023322_10820 [Rugosimonospora acidiphila]|uniref:Uncharacterized protein n=1 Tax=Rugosimonospora acidiphila TaxID=556531 RepID=A0ABP9RM73_9ACTN